MRALFVVGVFVLTIGATYNCVLFSDWSNICGGYDVFRAAGPLGYYMDYVIHDGELPLWNPLTFCGMPYAANPVTEFFYPGNLLRSLLSFHPTPFKTQVGWVVLMFLHLLLAGIGIFVLARDHRLSYSASFVAAFVFIFGAIWIRRICEYHFICMAAWLPLLLLLSRRALSQDDIRAKLRYGLAAGIMLGVSFLSGSMNMAPYMGVTLAGYVCLDRLSRIESLKIVSRSRLFRALAGDAVFLATLFVVGGLVAGALLLPGSEYAGFSARAKNGDFTLMYPHYRGTLLDLYHTIIRYPGLKWEPENIRGAGIGALLLVVAGLTTRRWRESLLYLALFLILFDCSLGRPFPIATLVEKLSPIQLIASTRAFDFALLPLGMLAALGVDTIAARMSTVWPRALRGGLLLAVGGITLWSLSGLLGPSTFLAMSRVALIPPAAALAVMVVAGWLPQFPAWRALLVALVFIETLIWNISYVPSIITSPNFAQWAGVYTGASSFWSDNRRGTDPIQNRHLYTLRPAMHGYEPSHIARVRKVLAGEVRGRGYERSVKGYEITQENHRGNLFLKRSFWLARQYVKGPLPDKHALFPATTTVFLPEADDLPAPRVDLKTIPARSVSEAAEAIHFATPAQIAACQAKPPASGKQRRILMPALIMPGVHSALCLQYSSACNGVIKPVFHDPATGRRELGKATPIRPTRDATRMIELPLPDFEQLGTELVIETPRCNGDVRITDAYLLADRADEDRLIRILSRTANTVDVSVGELSGYRLLTFLDAAYPGWKAYVDSRPVPIYLANDAFKAIVVPPGTHEVRFAFRPWRVYAGTAVSICSVLVALAGIYCLKTRAIAGK